MLDILNPSEDDIKLLTALIADGHADVTANYVGRLPTPVLRQFAMLALSLLAEVKSPG